MAKPAKKKVASLQSPKNGKRVVKTKRSQQTQMGADIDFDPAAQLRDPTPSKSPLLPRMFVPRASPEVLN